MESIVCNGIGKIYGKKQVLKNINLTLEKGKIYGLIEIGRASCRERV